MNAFFALVLDEVVLLEGVAEMVLSALLVVNVVLLVLISYILLRNVSSVFPTCPHASECGRLVHSLNVPVLRKISSFYSDVEKKMIAMEDEVAAKQSLELFDDGNMPNFDDLYAGTDAELNGQDHERSAASSGRSSVRLMGIRDVVSARPGQSNKLPMRKYKGNVSHGELTPCLEDEADGLLALKCTQNGLLSCQNLTILATVTRIWK
jgi:hypothetical protein